mmetsp:Transcript_83035/g.267571  ORF Transcript_83035/g.267571 Transcript_83035/m.267571 type:complete len:205 (-) Transcript_83035:970-1584(-)
MLRRGGLLHEGAELFVLEQRRGAAAVIVPEQAQGLAQARQAQVEILLGHGVILMSLHADFVHDRLLLRQSRQLGLEHAHLLLELRRLRGVLVDLGGELGDVVVQLALLGFCCGLLLIAVRLLGGLLLGLLLQLGDHIRDQALDFTEDILTVGGAILCHSGDARSQLRQGCRVVPLRELTHHRDNFGIREVCTVLQAQAGRQLQE